MKKLLATTILIIVFIFNSKAQNQSVFKNGETVCFLGNSITQAGIYQMVFQAYYATHFPGNKVKFISCGIGRDNAGHMIERFEKDVLIHKPDYVFLMTGMNDMYGELFEFDLVVDSVIISKREGALKTYKKLTSKLVHTIVKNNIKPILMTPSIFDNTAEIKTPKNPGKNDALEKCSMHIREIAKKYGTPLVDFNPFMLKINEGAQKTDPTFTIISKDRVHPEETGHFIMAYKIISTLYPGGSSSVLMLNGKKGIISEKANCDVKLGTIKGALEFQVRWATIPFPITADFEEAQRFVPFIEKYNRQIINIRRLKKGSYALLIDGTPVDTLTHKLLKKGINLTQLPRSSSYLQGEIIFDLCEKYHETQSILRVIAATDIKNLKDYNGPDTIKGKKKYLDIKVEKSKGKPWYEYVLQSNRTYYKNKPFEEEYKKELNSIRNKIYTSNIPQEHTYKFVKLE